MPIQIVQVTGFGDALDVLQDDGGHFRQTLGDHHITLRQDEDLSSILLHSPTFQRFQIENLTHQAVNQGEEATEFQPRCLFLYCHEDETCCHGNPRQHHQPKMNRIHWSPTTAQSSETISKYHLYHFVSKDHVQNQKKTLKVSRRSVSFFWSRSWPKPWPKLRWNIGSWASWANPAVVQQPRQGAPLTLRSWGIPRACRACRWWRLVVFSWLIWCFLMELERYVMFTFFKIVQVENLKDSQRKKMKSLKFSTTWGTSCVFQWQKWFPEQSCNVSQATHTSWWEIHGEFSGKSCTTDWFMINKG